MKRILSRWPLGLLVGMLVVPACGGGSQRNTATTTTTSVDVTGTSAPTMVTEPTTASTAEPTTATSPTTGTSPRPTTATTKATTGTTTATTHGRYTKQAEIVPTFTSSSIGTAHFTYIHFQVETTAGEVVATVAGSDSYDPDGERAGGAIRDTPERRALVDQLRSTMAASGWDELGVNDGWYNYQFAWPGTNPRTPVVTPPPTVTTTTLPATSVFDQITIGMTMDDVVRITGMPGLLTSSSSSFGDTYSFGNIFVTFKGGAVNSKYGG